MSKVKKIIPFLLLFFLILPLVWPLLQPGFFVTDDGNWMIIRLASFHQTLRTGQFPVRFIYSLNHGFGYPVVNFNYPLPFYLGEVVHLIGFGFVDSVKIIFILSFVLAAISMYLFISSKWGKVAGIICAIFYSYAPYRIYDVYTRGSLGEALAFVFIPLIFYFWDKFLSGKKNIYLSFACLSFAALITAHNTIAFITAPFILVYTLTEPFLSIIFLVLSIGASAFFWLPALHDLQFTKAATIQVASFSLYFINYENFSKLVGFIIPLILFFSLYLIRFRQKSVFYLSLLFVVISLFLASPVSAVIWGLSPLLSQTVQFPWRFLAVTTFGASILLAIIVTRFSKLLFLFPVAVLISYAFLPITTKQTLYPEGFYTTNDDTTTVKNEYMSKWVKIAPSTRPKSYLEIISGNAVILPNNWVSASSETKIRVNQIYFPGWVVKVDAKPTTISYSNDFGLIEFSVPAGKHKIDANFTETTFRATTNIISLVSLAILALLVL